MTVPRPTFALISSAGPSGQYHNPDITVMERLAAGDATIFSAYRSGDMMIEFYGGGARLSMPDDERLTLENYRDAA